MFHFPLSTSEDIFNQVTTMRFDAKAEKTANARRSGWQQASRFIIESVKRIVLTLILCFGVTASFGADNSSDQRLRVTVMVSDAHYDADKLLPPLMQKLGRENGWNVQIMHGHGGADFNEIELLDQTDVLVVYVRRLALPEDQIDRVKRYTESGRGLVALRTASHAFESNEKNFPKNRKNWPEFDREVLGGNYHNHGKNELGSDVNNVAEQADSLILRDVHPASWHSEGSLYFTGPIDENATVYQTASSVQREKEPLTWTRHHGKTRIAYTALGHQKDFDVQAFQKLLRNLVNWCGRAETKNSSKDDANK